MARGQGRAAGGTRARRLWLLLALGSLVLGQFAAATASLAGLLPPAAGIAICTASGPQTVPASDGTPLPAGHYDHAFCLLHCLGSRPCSTPPCTQALALLPVAALDRGGPGPFRHSDRPFRDRSSTHPPVRAPPSTLG